MVVNKSNDSSTTLVISVSQLGTETKFSNLERKLAFIEGVQWLANRLDTCPDILMANTKAELLHLADEQKATSALHGWEGQNVRS